MRKFAVRSLAMNFFFIILSSLLYGACFPPFNLWGCAFIALVPYFYVLDRIGSAAKTVLAAGIWGSCHGLVMGYWVFFALKDHYEVAPTPSALFFGGCVILPVMVIHMGFAAAYRFFKKPHMAFYALVVPALWGVAEFCKTVFSVLIPWGGIADALVPFLYFIQVADVIGSVGVIFLVAAANALVVHGVHQGLLMLQNRSPAIGRSLASRSPLKNLLLSAGVGVLLIGLPVIYGAGQVEKIDTRVARAVKDGNDADAVLVQGNFSAKERWSGMGFFHRVATYLEMSVNPPAMNRMNIVNTMAAVAQSPGSDERQTVIVWPETTLNSASALNDAFFMGLMQAIGENRLLVSGGLKTNPETGDVFNCAYVISGQGRLLRYDKHILLPYGETAPLVDFLGRYYTAPSEFTPGRTPTAIEAPGGKAGLSICFEILYSGHVRGSVKNGATYLVNISNDAWFGNSPMPHIHLNAARLRAIENRRFLLRASSSGISAIVDPAGRIISQSSLFTRERVDGRFVRLDAMSGYTRFGNLAVLVSFLILLGALLRVYFRGP